MSRARRLVGASVHVAPFPWLGNVDLAPPALPGPQGNVPPLVPAGPTSTDLSEIERQAFAKGYQQGERAGLEAGGHRAEAMIRRMSDTLEELGALRREMIQQTEAQIVRLALTIAKRILRREVSLDQDLTVAMARVALDRLGEHSGATIRLHPEDYARTVGTQPDGWDSDQVSVVADDNISRGGCRIESAFGFVEASVDAQFAEIEKAVMADNTTPAVVSGSEE